VVVFELVLDASHPERSGFPPQPIGQARLPRF
jgi:hypothetical protein